MSIATEIIRLRNAKNDIKTSIENKGVEIPNNTKLDDYYSYIDEIQSGIEIQNGRKVNYKATSGVVPAGTFIELNASYAKENISSIMGDSVTYNAINLTNINNNIYAFLNSNKLCSVIATENGITKYSEPFTLSKAISTFTNLVKVSDNLLFLFDSGGSNNYTEYLYVIQNNNGVFSITNTITLGTTNDYRHPISNLKLVKEDSDYWYFICVRYEQYVFSSMGYSSTLWSFKISKLDYTRSDTSAYTLSSNNSSYDTCRAEFEVIDDTHIVAYMVDDYIYYITIDWSSTTNRYSVIQTHWSTLNYNLITIAYLYLGNKHLFLAKQTIDNNPHLVCIEANIASSISISNIYDLGILTLSNYTKFEWSTKIINNYGIVLSKAYGDSNSLNYIILKVENGVLSYGNATQLSSISSTSPANYYGNIIGVVGNKLLIMFGAYMGLYTIDNTLVLQDSTDSSITIKPATSQIEGITTTECTTTIAGDVYLLDNSN